MLVKLTAGFDGFDFDLSSIAFHISSRTMGKRSYFSSHLLHRSGEHSFGNTKYNHFGPD